MRKTIRTTVAGLALLAGVGSAWAADHEVRMLNVGPNEQTMVFDPPLIHVQRGDTVTFVPTDRGHNAASMEGMIPPGAAPWTSAISEPVKVTFQVDGTYGYICEPHYGLGMVGLVLVGDYRANLEGARAVRQRGRAAQRFRALFAQAAAMPAEHVAGAVPALPPEAEGEATGGSTGVPAAEPHDMGGAQDAGAAE